MKIAIDLDGVVFDSEKMYFQKGCYYDSKVFCDTGIRDALTSKVEERFNWTKEQLQQFMDDNMLTICKTAPFMCGAKEGLLKLLNSGNELMFLTSRGAFFDEECEITKDILKQNKLDKIPLHFCKGNKLTECKEYNIDLLIDDYYNNVKKVSEGGVECVYFNTFSQKHFPKTNTLVKEVNSWQQLMEYLK